MKRFKRFVGVVAVLSAATTVTAAAALGAVTVRTLAPKLDGNTATFYGEVASDCGGPVAGWFLVTDMSSGRTYDSLLDWGHPDQFSSNGSMTGWNTRRKILFG